MERLLAEADLQQQGEDEHEAAEEEGQAEVHHEPGRERAITEQVQVDQRLTAPVAQPALPPHGQREHR
jgi:hypothetical protein